MTELSDDRIEIIRMTGNLIRGDWSGYDFDGRDVKKWLDIALDGTPTEIAMLHKELKERLERP